MYRKVDRTDRVKHWLVLALWGVICLFLAADLLYSVTTGNSTGFLWLWPS